MPLMPRPRLAVRMKTAVTLKNKKNLAYAITRVYITNILTKASRTCAAHWDVSHRGKKAGDHRDNFAYRTVLSLSVNKEIP
jgi:hypothetical protein